MIESSKANPVDVFVGRKIRERRQKLGWTLSELAEKLNISHQQVQKYEQGNTRVSAGVLYYIARILGTSTNYFFEGYNPERVENLKYSEVDTISFARRSYINVLLIEDDPSDELLTRKALEECQPVAKVYCLHDGEAVLEFLRNQKATNPFPRPDIIFLDLNIPKRDGHFVLKEIKRSRETMDIPVVILTNSISKKEMVSVYQNYASGYICKSFDFATFKRQIISAVDYWSNTVVLPNMN